MQRSEAFELVECRIVETVPHLDDQSRPQPFTPSQLPGVDSSPDSESSVLQYLAWAAYHHQQARAEKPRTREYYKHKSLEAYYKRKAALELEGPEAREAAKKHHAEIAKASAAKRRRELAETNPEELNRLLDRHKEYKRRSRLRKKEREAAQLDIRWAWAKDATGYPDELIEIARELGLKPEELPGLQGAAERLWTTSFEQYIRELHRSGDIGSRVSPAE